MQQQLESFMILIVRTTGQISIQTAIKICTHRHHLGTTGIDVDVSFREIENEKLENQQNQIRTLKHSLETRADLTKRRKFNRLSLTSGMQSHENNLFIFLFLNLKRLNVSFLVVHVSHVGFGVLKQTNKCANNVQVSTCKISMFFDSFCFVFFF